MSRELTTKEIMYDVDFSNLGVREDTNYLPEYDDVYGKIKLALDIDAPGYNIYLIDDFSKDKLSNIEKFIGDSLKNKSRPKDLCYVIKDDDRAPVAMFLEGGKGTEFKEMIEKIQKMYLECVYDFYNNSTDKDKEYIIETIQKKRTELITKLIKTAHDDGFDMKSTAAGFTFIPFSEGDDLMTEKEYDELEGDKKEEILQKVSKLKVNAQDILEELKDSELSQIEKLKVMLKKFLDVETADAKKEYGVVFEGEKGAIEYLNHITSEIEKNLVDAYSLSYEDDEEDINGAVLKYACNVIVDNSKDAEAPIVFEDDPSVSNLIGSIDYENRNGVYTTDISLIKGGSMLKANGGCLVLRASSLFSNPSAYYYLKKSLLNEKVNFDYNRGYLELLSLNGLKPEPVKIKEKVIIIGDFETYDLLYSYDEDFKKIFKIRAEYNPVVKISTNSKRALIDNIYRIHENHNLKPFDESAVKEVAKHLSRKAENRNKMYFDDFELNRIMMIANNHVESQGKELIKGEDIINATLQEEQFEKELLEAYQDNLILINVKDQVVGQINGLSVIDAGYFSIGKPMRITCSCYKGSGEIVDAQKDSNLSGNIHNKAVNTLRGYINSLNDDVDKLPVDFHLCFEQLYGKVDGDSASVAEAVVMLSALAKIPVKQNIAVTGSINQFGQVQPIGGVNEKIEGFFKVCKLMDDVKGKGVIIPVQNVKNIVLSGEVEEAVARGDFTIYAMDKVEDAIDILMCNENLNLKEVSSEVKSQIAKYKDKKGKSRKKE